MLRSMSRFACAVVLALACWSAPARAQSQPPQPQDGFVPVGDSPVQEQLPAAPLLIGAYIVVLGGLFVYVVSLARRIGAVQRDVERLESDLKRRGAARS
jgi:hypothetical protein